MEESDCEDRQFANSTFCGRANLLHFHKKEERKKAKVLKKYDLVGNSQLRQQWKKSNR